MLTFFLAYYFWVTVHMQREFWAMSKKAIRQENQGSDDEMSLSFLGTLDTCLFFSYSLFQFMSGSIGDNFNKRLVLIVSYIIQGLAFSVLGIAGTYESRQGWQYIICFTIIGLSQSLVFPCLVSIIGSWFAKANRGFITGSWGTCTNIGNILGI